jgi:hypothetical protein
VITIGTIVKSRRSHSRRFLALRRKNGARLPKWRVAGGWRLAEFVDVKFGSSAASDPGPLAPSAAKWRFKPLEKRHLAPFFTPKLAIFSEFFCELFDLGANWRDFDPKSAEMSSIRRCDRIAAARDSSRRILSTIPRKPTERIAGGFVSLALRLRKTKPRQDLPVVRAPPGQPRTLDPP